MLEAAIAQLNIEPSADTFISAEATLTLIKLITEYPNLSNYALVTNKYEKNIAQLQQLQAFSFKIAKNESEKIYLKISVSLLK